MSIYMETTKIEVGQTVAEIQRKLGEHGATAVMTKYDGGEVIAVCFEIMFLDRRIPFLLPARWQAIEQNLRGRKKRLRTSSLDAIEDQAKRVAWRQILRWIEAQLALVETDMVKIHEVFLPYMQVDLKGTTLSQSFEQNKFKMLESPK